MSYGALFLDPLITTYVPASRSDEPLRHELASHCQDILNSYIGMKTETNFVRFTDSVKRRLLQSPNGNACVSRFNNLVERLLEQPVLSHKKEAIIFLYALSSMSSRRKEHNEPRLFSQPIQYKHQVKSEIDVPASQHTPHTSTNALRLHDYRISMGISHIDEPLLVRDTLYLMQGISGKHVTFICSKDNEKKVVFNTDPHHVIAKSIQILILRLAELGHLYCRVETFVREREHAPGVGMIEQSLCHYLQAQLTEYYRFIAILETQLASSERKSALRSELSPEHETGLSLRRLDVWVNDWRLRMRMMSVCVEGAQDAHGGALVNLIHSYTDNGDPFVRKFTHELLEEVSRPFFATLHKWLFSGELYDPFEEFFVTADSSLGHVGYVHPSSIPGGINHLGNDDGFGSFNVDSEDLLATGTSGRKLWETKYRFRKDMLPMFVGESFGKKIFSTGKSLNFIRYSCLDSDWVVTREKMSNTGGILQYGDIKGLERSIDTAYQVASQRLFEVFIDKFKLLDHLYAIKCFILLGHGDFADQLIETLGPSLGKPANTLHRHNLTVDLETAIRSSNAQKDPSGVLRRLDARMLEYSHGEIGWDVFTLEYKVSPPIDTVLDQETMANYLKLFKHLWQLKRLEKTLNQGWTRVTGGVHNFIRLSHMESEWHKIRLTIAEMVHFNRQLEAYCRVEVIECSWKKLVDFLHQKEGDLDALIDGHRTYLERITKKILLWNPRAGKEELLLRHLDEIFAIILQYKEATDNLYNHCLSESARRDQERDHERGVYTGNSELEPLSDNLSRLLNIVKDYGSQFSEKIQAMVQQLQIHPDLDCRFLGVRLSFSEYYKSKKEKESTANSKPI